MSKMGFITDKVNNAAAVPLHMQELLLGVIEIQNKRGSISIGFDDIRMLQVLADQTALSINTIVMYKQLAATDRIQREMEFARDLQRRCLPKEIPSPRHAHFSVYFQPAKEIGGDYFDFITKRSGEFNIIIGDVSGKGLPAGMIMIMAYTALHIIARNEKDVGEVVKTLSQEMYDKVGVGQFMTLNYLEWRDEERTLRYAGAGHEYIIWYHKANGEVDRIKTGGLALGLVADQTPHVKKWELKTSPGDVVVLYTDGIIDARNSKSEMFSFERLLSAVERYAALGESEKIQKSIINDVKSFMGDAEQYDDMTLVVLTVS
jgi:serine phosphatase RsbU (regulator of sigma subunit)